jgi:hypothetical protein
MIEFNKPLKIKEGSVLVAIKDVDRYIQFGDILLVEEIEEPNISTIRDEMIGHGISIGRIKLINGYNTIYVPFISYFRLAEQFQLLT